MTRFPGTEAPGISVFYKDDEGAVFHTYSTFGRGVEVMMGTYNMLDLVPEGRGERDVPNKMEWVRHHDRYEPAPSGRLVLPRERLKQLQGRAHEHVMTSLWPWLAVAGVGALHGLNPANGWLLAADAGRALARSGAGTARACCRSAWGTSPRWRWWPARWRSASSLDRAVLQVAAVGLLLVAAAVHLRRRAAPRVRAPAGHAALALWSFTMSTAHGAGLMLVPALMPLCLADASARQITASGSLLLALAAVAVHSAAMLAVTGGVATGACRGVGATRRWARRSE